MVHVEKATSSSYSLLAGTNLTNLNGLKYRKSDQAKLPDKSENLPLQADQTTGANKF